ncbi:Protein mak16 [Capsicum annuum]|nr:Protein mak16 [Capsicum annuum]
MQHDEVIWQVIRHKHCSFMAKIETGIFCRNQYNVTGICNRSSCPLANSRYATIRDHDGTDLRLIFVKLSNESNLVSLKGSPGLLLSGVFYLYMKTIERAHMPNKLWERIKLPRNYEKALEIIDKNLMYWPKFLVHKAKQRLTKMTQMRIRMRKLALKTREKIMTTPRKETKRESRRQEKAEKAALLDKSIEKELLERLSKGVYGDIYNYPEQKYQEILDREAMQEANEEEDEEEYEVEYVEGYEDLEEEDDMEDFDGLGIRDSGLDTGIDGEDNDDDDEEAVTVHRKSGRKDSALARRKADKDDPNAKSKKKAKVEHDYTGPVLKSKGISCSPNAIYHHNKSSYKNFPVARFQVHPCYQPFYLNIPASYTSCNPQPTEQSTPHVLCEVAFKEEVVKKFISCSTEYTSFGNLYTYLE